MKVRNKRDFRNDIISVFQPPSPTTKNTKLNSRTTEQVLKPRWFYYRTLRLLHATFHRVLFFDRSCNYGPISSIHLANTDGVHHVPSSGPENTHKFQLQFPPLPR